MVTSVQKWGNSLALRIPKVFANQVQLDVDSLVDISVVDDNIVIARVRRPQFTLADLLRDVTPENTHGEFDMGPAAGLEAI